VTARNQSKMGRREFLARAGKAGISIAAAGAISYKLYDRQGPAISVDTESLVTLTDFSTPYKAGQTISVVKGPDRVKTVNKAIELLGGIERFVKPGETVAIKPNVAFASPPMLGATVHPDLVAEVVRLCYSRGGARKVIVTDEPFRKVDKLIGISPVKDHHRAGASMSMKNWYGLLGGRRNIFHQDINSIIAELAMMVKPTLVILDGTEVMMTNGPTGGSLSDLRRTNTLIASTDCVAADSYGCGLLDLEVSDLLYLAKAQIAGAGTTDYESLKPIFATVG